MWAQIGNSLIHTTQARTLAHTHTQRARPDQRLPFGWTWQWFWNVDNCQIKITQAISQAQIWMQVSEQKEIATGYCPSDFPIYHSVSCALWNEATEKWGRSASNLEIISFHICVDLQEGNTLVLYWNVQIRAWLCLCDVSFSFLSWLPARTPGEASVSSREVGAGGLGQRGACLFPRSQRCCVVPMCSWQCLPSLSVLGNMSMFLLPSLGFKLFGSNDCIASMRVSILAPGTACCVEWGFLRSGTRAWRGREHGARGLSIFCLELPYLLAWIEEQRHLNYSLKPFSL